jgi:MYXO-CTERM domain-containing protein
MKTARHCLFHLAAIAGLTLSAHAATSFFENFDASTSLPAGWSVNNNVTIWTDPAYANSGSNTLTIVETRNSNYVTTPSLGLIGATTASISFYWTTGPNSGAFGRFPQIQYSSDGSSFTKIAEIAVPANTALTSPALFTHTITTADDGFSFTADSVFRIVGDNDGGGGGAPLAMDDFSVTSDGIPEPTTALLGGLGLLAMLRRRR